MPARRTLRANADRRATTIRIALRDVIAGRPEPAAPIVAWVRETAPPAKPARRMVAARPQALPGGALDRSVSTDRPELPGLRTAATLVRQSRSSSGRSHRALCC